MKALKTTLFGPEGIGKSTFASQFPDPLFIDTEGSTNYMDVKRLPKPESWNMILEEIKYVLDHPNVCKTLVIDTMDWAERICINDFCSSKNLKGIEDLPYGRGYTYVAEEIGRMLNGLSQVVNKGINVVLVAHAMMRKFEQPDELGTYDRWELKLQKKNAPLVKEWSDLLLFTNYKTVVVNIDGKNKAQGGKRIMYTSHHPCWDAKNRFGLPDELPFEFKSIAHLFGSNLPNTEQKPIHEESTTPTQNVEIPQESPGISPQLKQLLDASHISEQDLIDEVVRSGYFPADMTINDYPEDFIGFIISNWQGVVSSIQANKGGQS